MIFSALLTTAIAFPLAKRDAEIPSNCKILDTLFLQCSNGDGQAPTLYAPQCTLDAQYHFVSCCAVTPSGEKTDFCTSSYDAETSGCQVLDTTLQLLCHSSDGGLSLLSPTCSGSSDGSGQCCARNQDGSKGSQCSSTPASGSGQCTILSDLTTQCDTPSGIVRTPPSCETNGGTRKCCAVYQDGSDAGKCYAVA